ncbi:MAG: dTMP kinase [Pseudomonadales bacterium]|nr:dTMP kinase [Pseudomonadales bacterium]
MNTRPGKFITVEGVEGVGKSTNINLMAKLIRDAGHEVLLTREPGGTRLGERVRQILLDKAEDTMSPMTELMLMFAARAQHVEELIKPALADGQWVVCDRFTDSSYAYQGGGRGLGDETVAMLETLALGDFRPDLTLILDLDVATGLSRATADAEADRFESEERAFFEKVRTAFLDRVATSDRYRLIDASGNMEEVQAQITSLMTEVLSK